MATTTETIRCIPEYSKGISCVTVATSWRPSAWKVIAPLTNSDMYIIGLNYQVTQVPSADTTYESVVEVGIGATGNEVVVIQSPYSFRADTAVGHYMDRQKVFFPDPYYVPRGTTVSVRIAVSNAAAVTIQGIKLMVYDSVRPVQPNEIGQLVNSNNINVGNNMSVTERGGCFR